jgi:hypothetical protein
MFSGEDPGEDPGKMLISCFPAKIFRKEENRGRYPHLFWRSPKYYTWR